MKISELFEQKKPVIGFEIFPPRADVSIDSIYDSLEKFIALKPDYISVTYGAGGSQKGRTVEIASKIKNEYNVESMAHFTCIGHSKSEINQMLNLMEKNNLANVLALRGDIPDNPESSDTIKDSYSYANELVSHIRSEKNFCIAAAAYLEGHVDCRRLKDDLHHLKQKVDTGVDFLITQLFFDNRLFYDFLEKARAAGITCPIIPGIMPIFKADQIKAITAKSGCSIPAKLVLMMDEFGNDPEGLRRAGIEFAAQQIRDLLDNGTPGIHLYTMNRPKSTKEIMQKAGLI
ncbi:MAG: methylenetetrahydrofolate reductase [NAD(P)H] [Clostridia bacterium]|jgi:methylenetetrahydrofolate reductase (NADPH)